MAEIIENNESRVPVTARRDHHGVLITHQSHGQPERRTTFVVTHAAAACLFKANSSAPHWAAPIISTRPFWQQESFQLMFKYVVLVLFIGR